LVFDEVIPMGRQ